MFPATLADLATVAATDTALARDDLSDMLRTVLLEQKAILQQVLAARTGVARGYGYRARISAAFVSASPRMLLPFP